MSIIFMYGGFAEVKPNYFEKQHSSSSLLLTSGNNTGQKWQWSAQKASSMF
jgi:hypothetical protein